MTEQRSDLITFGNIVNNVLLDMHNEADLGMQKRLLQYAIRIWRNKLVLFHLPYVKTVELTMNDLNAVTLPDDCSRFISVGVPYRNRYWTFTEDGRMLLTGLGGDCGEQVLDEDDGEGENLEETGDRAGYSIPGGRNDYYYKMDARNNRIILNGFSRTTVRVKYISTGIRVDKETVVPVIAQEAMIAGVHMLRLRHDPKAARVDKDHAERLFNLEIENLEHALMPTVDQLYDTYYKTVYQSAKR